MTKESGRRRLSAAEFQLATEGLTIKPELKLAAYRYMVDQTTFEVAAQESGIPYTSIQRKVRQIYALHRPPLPRGWRTELVSLPEPEMDRVRELSRRLLKER